MNFRVRCTKRRTLYGICGNMLKNGTVTQIKLLSPVFRRGHVAASLGTMWNSKELEGFVKEYLHTEPEMIRPDGMLLGYPVITSGEKAHRKSFERLLGTRYEQLLESVSLEERVTKDTPQTFYGIRLQTVLYR